MERTMNSPVKNDHTTSPAGIASSSDRSGAIPGLSGGLAARSATKTRKKSAAKTKKTMKPIKVKTTIKISRKKSAAITKKTKKPIKAKTIIKKTRTTKKTRKKSGSKRITPVVKKIGKVKSKNMMTTTKNAKSTRKSITAQKTTRKTATKAKAAKSKITRKTTVKKLKEARDPEFKRRRARLYSVRSRLSSYQLGDDVIFKKVRDWNNHSKTIEMRGTVIALGCDPNISVNYIEVQFEIENHPGTVTMQVRRFTVK